MKRLLLLLLAASLSASSRAQSIANDILVPYVDPTGSSIQYEFEPPLAPGAQAIQLYDGSSGIAYPLQPDATLTWDLVHGTLGVNTGALPAGPTGATGAPGSGATVTLGTVSTLSAGSSATVSNSGSSSAVVLNFGIPAGSAGSTGATGSAGAAGTNGTNGTNATTTSNATTSTAGLESGADKTQLTNLPAILERQRLQTDASGNLTWTYPTAFGSGVVPVIGVVAEGGSTVPLNVQTVGAPTNTSVTFKVLSLPSTSVLSIVVLGAPTGAQAYLHLTAMSP